MPATRRSSAGSATSLTAASPIRASCRGPRAFAARGEIRHQYTHAIDVMPTMLDVLGVEPPVMFNGVPQEEIAGASFKATFAEPQARGNPHPAILRDVRLPRDLLRWLEGRHVPSHPRHPGRRRRRSLRAVHAGQVGAVPRGRGLFGVSRSGRAGAGTPADDDRAVVC